MREWGVTRYRGSGVLPGVVEDRVLPGIGGGGYCLGIMGERVLPGVGGGGVTWDWRRR